MDIEGMELNAEVYSATREQDVDANGGPLQQPLILVRPQSRDVSSVAQLLDIAGFRLDVSWHPTEPMWLYERHARNGVILLDCGNDPYVCLRLLWGFKRRGVQLPIICMVTRRLAWLEETALELGAADVIERTVRPSILERRIGRAALMNGVADAGSDAAPRLEVGPLQLNVGASRCRWRGRPVEVTVTEFRVIHLLASSAEVDVSYREIYDAVRGKGFVAGDGPNGYRTNVRSLIKRIRRKFLAIDPAFDEIRNFAGFGYKWCAPRLESPVPPRRALAGTASLPRPDASRSPVPTI